MPLFLSSLLFFSLRFGSISCFCNPGLRAGEGCSLKFCIPVWERDDLIERISVMVA
jgi:hypothetical protein